jgi:hypothetical protein
MLSYFEDHFLFFEENVPVLHTSAYHHKKRDCLKHYKVSLMCEYKTDV